MIRSSEKIIIVCLYFFSIFTFSAFAEENEKIKGSKSDDFQKGVYEELKEALQDKVFSNSRKEIEDIINSALAKKFPAKPFIAKIKEGLAKNASGEKIVHALHVLESRFDVASSILTKNKIELTPQNLEAIVDMLSAGISEKGIGNFISEVRSALKEHDLRILSISILILKSFGMDENQAFKKVIGIYLERGAEGVRNEIKREKEIKEKSASSGPSVFKYGIKKAGSGKILKGKGGKGGR